MKAGGYPGTVIHSLRGASSKQPPSAASMSMYLGKGWGKTWGFTIEINRNQGFFIGNTGDLNMIQLGKTTKSWGYTWWCPRFLSELEQVGDVLGLWSNVYIYISAASSS